SGTDCACATTTSTSGTGIWGGPDLPQAATRAAVENVATMRRTKRDFMGLHRAPSVAYTALTGDHRLAKIESRRPIVPNSLLYDELNARRSTPRSPPASGSRSPLPPLARVFDTRLEHRRGGSVPRWPNWHVRWSYIRWAPAVGPLPCARLRFVPRPT